MSSSYADILGLAGCVQNIGQVGQFNAQHRISGREEC